MENNSKTKIIYTAILVVLLLAITGAYVYRKNNMNQVVEVPVAQNNNNSTNTTNTGKLPGYKNGSYNVTATYNSPAGAETFGLQIELANNIITSAVMTPMATNPISKQLQDGFEKAYKTLVVGKSIDDVKLDKVSGASLTTKGFNDGIEKIKVLANQNV